MKLFRRKPKTVRVPTYYRVGGGWGNKIEWWNWEKRRVVGWQDRIPRPGDRLFSEMKSGQTAEFEFVSVDWQLNPADMFFATVKYVGYVEVAS